MTRARATADTQDNNGGAVAPFVAGKNAVINGGMDYFQRGTSFTSSAGVMNTTFHADRWSSYFFAGSGSSNNITVSQQALTPGDIAGFYGASYLRQALPAGASGYYWETQTKIEDVRTLAGQTVTLSLWARVPSGSSTTGITWEIEQNFGSGGSTGVFQYIPFGGLTTSWQRFSYTFNLASVAGKTIGANSFLKLKFYGGPSGGATTAFTLDVTGVQLEAGSVATPFSRAAGTLQGELAACQRYYYRFTGDNNAQDWFSVFGVAYSSTNATIYCQHPVTMRAKPTAVDFANLIINRIDTGGQIAVSSLALNNNNPNQSELIAVGGGFLANFAICQLRGDGSGVPFIGFSAEL